MKQRIWELDALRGFCILCVILVHLIFDLNYFLDLSIGNNAVFLTVQKYGGAVFVVLSGLCVTLGRRSFRRGVIVLGCGLLVTGVTYGLKLVGLDNGSISIWFGVLHLLGVCMILWPLLKRMPTWLLAVWGLALVVAGYAIADTVITDNVWLYPLGFRVYGLGSGDYFPLMPNLGWFLLGAVLGRTLYRKQTTLLPRVNYRCRPIWFLCWCGRHSLWIYLVHQPLLYGLLMLF